MRRMRCSWRVWGIVGVYEGLQECMKWRYRIWGADREYEEQLKRMRRRWIVWGGEYEAELERVRWRWTVWCGDGQYELKIEQYEVDQYEVHVDSMRWNWRVWGSSGQHEMENGKRETELNRQRWNRRAVTVVGSECQWACCGCQYLHWKVNGGIHGTVTLLECHGWCGRVKLVSVSEEKWCTGRYSVGGSYRREYSGQSRGHYWHCIVSNWLWVMKKWWCHARVGL